jgi:hypothetical protein
MLHEFENRDDLTLHLKQNGKKFSDQCVRLMTEMYRGRKLTHKIAYEEFGCDTRRLRDCRQHRPDIVRSRWEVDKDGKTKYMLFWIEIVHPSKQKAIEMGEKILQQMRDNELNQGELF